MATIPEIHACISGPAIVRAAIAAGVKCDDRSRASSPLATPWNCGSRIDPPSPLHASPPTVRGPHPDCSVSLPMRAPVKLKHWKRTGGAKGSALKATSSPEAPRRKTSKADRRGFRTVCAVRPSRGWFVASSDVEFTSTKMLRQQKSGIFLHIHFSGGMLFSIRSLCGGVRCECSL